MNKIIFLISLMLFLLMGINSYSQEISPPATQRQMQTGKLNAESNTKSNIESKGNNISPNPISPINIIDTNSNHNTAQNINKPNNDGQFGAVNDDPITRYTFWLMIFTAFLVICNILLWPYTKKAADAAKKAADALPIVERAYIFVTHVSLPKIIEENIYEIPVTISNVGKTPAILIQATAACVWADRYPKRHQEIMGEYPRGGAIIATNESIDILRPKIKITAKDSEKIKTKEIKLLICGRIVYNDVWKVRHETGFCWEFTPLDLIPGFTLVNDDNLNYYT